MKIKTAAIVLALPSLLACSAPADEDGTGGAATSAAQPLSGPFKFEEFPAPGCATAIAASDANPWVLGCGTVDGVNRGIYHWTPTAACNPSVRACVPKPAGGYWAQVPGGATEITVSATGTPWVLSADGAIWKWNGSSFALYPVAGCATSIAVEPNTVGAGDIVWVVGCDTPVDGDRSIYSSRGGGAWSRVPGVAARKVVGAEQGWKFALASSGNVFVLFGDAGAPLGTRCASDIAGAYSPLGSATSRVFALGCGSATNNPLLEFDVFKQAWLELPGQGVKLAVDTAQTPYVIDAQGKIYRAVADTSPQ